MPTPFNPGDVAQHRMQYKLILHDARSFVNTTSLQAFTRGAYRLHLEAILDRLAAELGSIREDHSCQAQTKTQSPSSTTESKNSK